MHAHRPGEELADFTENELLSLIDAGTVGAYSEIYRRYRDDAVARASSSLPLEMARQLVDDAFLDVLRSLLNKTADTSASLQSTMDDTINERLADLESSNDSSTSASASSSANDVDDLDHSLVAEAFSTLPDNWQRILWLREVEQFSPEAVADRLNISTAVVDRLSLRAHHDLQKTWNRTRPKGNSASADHRSALIPALLTSPTVTERLADTLAQTPPDPAGLAGRSESAIANAATVDTGTELHEEEAVEADTSPGAALETSPEPTAAPAPAPAPTPSPVDTSSQSTFTMPKPVLIPVIAASIGLLGTLVGLAIVPESAEHTGIRPGSGTSAISTVDTSTDKDDASRDSQSPGHTPSDKGNRKPGSENSKTSAPEASHRDENEKSSQNPQDDAGRTDDSPSEDNRDDTGDRPSSKDSDEPSPSDSERPDPESPSDPGPEPPAEPTSPADPTPSDPSPPDPPPSDPSPPTDPTPSEPAPTEPEEPTSDPTPSDSETAPAPDPTQDAPSTGSSTSSN